MEVKKRKRSFGRNTAMREGITMMGQCMRTKAGVEAVACARALSMQRVMAWFRGWWIG